MDIEQVDWQYIAILIYCPSTSLEVQSDMQEVLDSQN